ncbi:hypothetical protein [Cupriavidus basilensis]|uniref:hypothetical protein n=1 Tax=Cupriavidus basilensis TaxID=68895 RepID=UPI00284CB4AE|nr:hypothetical protein [Cupriavidus basilensis]MDR3382295.1 hypothetical protein [Cupriavidus basilensis]
MSTFVIDDREWGAMRMVDHLARDLYTALRRSMDYATGVVGGPAKAISWWSLREDTELPGRPGVKAYKPSEQQLRRRMVQLEKVGLVRSIGSKLRLKFKLLLARTSSFVQKIADTGARVSGAARKPKPVKRSPGYAQGNNEPKAGTHLVSDKTKTQPEPPLDSDAGGATLNPPPHACGAGGEQNPPSPPAEAQQLAAEDNPAAGAAETGLDLAPHAYGAGGEPDPQMAPTEAQRLSEERQWYIQGGGDGPPAQLAGGQGFEWQDDRAWPVRLDVSQRRRLRRELDGLASKTLGQRVLDELRGAMRATVVKDPWAYFHRLLREAKKKGDAWVTVYAEKIAADREIVRQTMARQKAEDAAFAATLRDKPVMKPAELLRFIREHKRAGR